MAAREPSFTELLTQAGIEADQEEAERRAGSYGALSRQGPRAIASYRILGSEREDEIPVIEARRIEPVRAVPIPMPAPERRPERCSYCKTGNLAHAVKCESCGAPL